jgi:formamidopyrimidine-DNA glycosylase
MPELPEVETIVRKLQQVLPGKAISEVFVFHPKTFVGEASLLPKLEVAQVMRRAKIIRIQLSNGFNLIIHLKMTGQLIYVDQGRRLGGGHPTTDWVNDLPSKHTRFSLVFRDRSTLFFNDQRLFGCEAGFDQEVASSLLGAR